MYQICLGITDHLEDEEVSTENKMIVSKNYPCLSNANLLMNHRFIFIQLHKLIFIFTTFKQ
jgi:hypothetical protein